jgi:ABC-2 type transport system ATP-binding protein
VAVQVNGLRMRFGGTEVLHGVDFDVRYGEVFCLLGPNGAGKTTTLEILEGFRPPTGGKVQVLGLDPAAQSARLRERAGMVLQECGFPRQARVAELIDLWRTYYPNPRTSPVRPGVTSGCRHQPPCSRLSRSAAGRPR